MRRATGTDRYQDLVAVQRQFFGNRLLLRERYGAYSTAIGFRLRQSEVDSPPPDDAAARLWPETEVDDLCLRVFVEEKLRDAHDGRQLLHRWEEFKLEDGRVVRIPIDICAVEQPRRHIDFAYRVEALKMNGEALDEGSVGGWAWDDADQSLVLLSNAHVFSVSRHASILQDGVIVATAKDGIQDPFIDVAKADPTKDIRFDPDAALIGPCIFNVGEASAGLDVHKFSAGSGFSTGMVRYENYAFFDTDYNVGMLSGFAVRGSDSSSFSHGGDSGSLIAAGTSQSADAPPTIVGLLCGEHVVERTENHYTFAFHIQDVFEALTVTSLAVKPFAAFLDHLLQLGSGPFHFYRRDRPDSRFPDFRQEYRNPAEGESLLALLAGAVPDEVAECFRSHRPKILKLLVAELGLREQIEDGLRPLLEGQPSADAVWRSKRTCSADTARLLTLAARTIAATLNEAERMRPLVDALAQAEGRTIPQVLALTR